MAFRATLNFRKFKVALNATYRFFLNFGKSRALSCLSNSDYIKKFTVQFLNYKPLKLQLRELLAGHTVAMVTYFVMERTTMCSPIIGQCFDTLIVASSDKDWLQWPMEILVLETVLSHLNSLFHHLCLKCYAAQHSYAPLLSLRRDSPPKSYLLGG